MDVVELLPRLHFFRFPIGHAYLWSDPDGLTLIDTGVVGSADEIGAAVESLGHRRSDVRRIVLTHFHRDHVGSAAQIARWGPATVYAHRAEAPVIEGLEPGPDAVLLDWERELQARLSGQVPAADPEPVRIDRTLDDGDTLEFGGTADAVAVGVPGHTPGSLAIYLPGPGVLFTGDTIARAPDGRVMLGVFNVDRAQAIASFHKQAALDVAIACFGHGEPLTDDATASLRATAARLT